MIKKTSIATLVSSLLATGLLTSGSVIASSTNTGNSSSVVSPVFFNTNDFPSDLTGNLSATVLFAQSQIIPSKQRIEGDRQPHLTAQRTTLVMMQPKGEKLDATVPLRVTVTDAQGKILGTLEMNPPEQLPETVYYLAGIPEEGIDFTPLPGASTVIRGSANLAKLDDSNGKYLQSQLQSNSLVEIQTADGSWVRNIYLPQSTEMENKTVKLVSRAGYNSTIFYSGRSSTLSSGNTLLFKYVKGQWVRQGEFDNNNLKYAENMWSAQLPARWINPGISLTFTHGERSGILNDNPVGAPSELLIHTIDIGMLTTPRNAFAFATDPNAHREYFQTVPVSRLIVNQYESLHLTEVMLPDGTLLTDFDPSEGGWHSGTMRQRIGKELISLGIDNANYGINSSIGEGESGHPYLAAQLAAHNSRGKYANGVQVHGGSGGGGMVTLDSSLGNEFSHEVGHNYGLGHYVDGFRGSVHRTANEVNSTWGWDAVLNRFIPNFNASKSNKNACLDGVCQLPFDGHSFGFDSMAGGAPMSNLNRFTLYTPNSATLIQRFLENKAVFAADSETGFKRWDATTETMVPYRHKVSVAEQITAVNRDLSEAYFTELFKDYARVRVAMSDGNWTKMINVPVAAESNKGKAIEIDHRAGYNSHLQINGQSVLISNGTKKSYVSNGQLWLEQDAPDLTIERRPQEFGVPVTTLVGYYDPKGILPTYIYPALHGAYGFTYADDNPNLAPDDCKLQVETALGSLLNYRLSNVRVNINRMNKFHINIAESVKPVNAAVICRGQSLDSKALLPAQNPLKYTVNGAPLKAEEMNNQPPVAHAGDDIQASGATVITLDGTASRDPENKPLRYRWRQVSGDSVNLQQADQAQVQVMLGDISQDKTYGFELTVMDAEGLIATDRVNVLHQPVNLPPEVSVPDNLKVNAGESVTIRVQAHDPEGAALTYLWLIPEGVTAEGINNDTLIVTAPHVINETGYSLRVQISDGHHVVERTVQLSVKGNSCSNTDPEAGKWSAWQSTNTYVGGDTVSHNQLVWRAKYWTQGNEPMLEAPQWSLVSQVDLGWSAKATYQGGEMTNHQGRRWKAKWWTQGNEPGQHDVWEDVGPASCS